MADGSGSLMRRWYAYACAAALAGCVAEAAPPVRHPAGQGGGSDGSILWGDWVDLTSADTLDDPGSLITGAVSYDSATGKNTLTFRNTTAASAFSAQTAARYEWNSWDSVLPSGHTYSGTGFFAVQVEMPVQASNWVNAGIVTAGVVSAAGDSVAITGGAASGTSGTSKSIWTVYGTTGSAGGASSVDLTSNRVLAQYYISTDETTRATISGVIRDPEYALGYMGTVVGINITAANSRPCVIFGASNATDYGDVVEVVRVRFAYPDPGDLP